MEMWFSDEHTDNVKLSIRVDKQLFSAQSEFQRIDVLESKEFGKLIQFGNLDTQTVVKILNLFGIIGLIIYINDNI